MKTTHTILLSLILAIITASDAYARTFTPVPAPEEHTCLTRDSLFMLDIPSAKATVTYRDFHSQKTVTTYTDENGHTLLAIVESPAYKVPRVNIDTTLLSPSRQIIRKIKATYLDGKIEKYRIYDSEDPELLWEHIPEGTALINSDLIGIRHDSHGNWTELHNRYGTDQMDPDANAHREISYQLTPEEQEMLARFTSMRSSVRNQKTGYLTIGLIIFLIGAVIAIYTLTAGNISDSLRPKLAGIASGPLVITGFYLAWTHLHQLTGTVPAVIAGTVFVLLMSLYMRHIIVMLEDNEKLSNWEIEKPFIITKIGLLYIGWTTGALLWGIWWGALLTMAVFAIPIFSVPDRGERCSKCHKVGGVRHVKDIECGFRIETKRHSGYGYDDVVVRKIRRSKTLRRCVRCGYQYETPEKDAGTIWEKTSRELHARANDTSGNKANQPLQNIDYKDPSLYLRARFSLHDCSRWSDSNGCESGADKKGCSYPYDQVSCPYFSPSGRYQDRARSIVKSDNTPI